MRKIRGNQISMIFQEPMTSLNPVYTVGQQIGEASKIHQSLNKKSNEKAIEMLRLLVFHLQKNESINTHLSYLVVCVSA